MSNENYEIFSVIQNIYHLGGRSFWIHNTGPVGCLAYVFERVPVSTGEIDMAGCAIPFNKVAKYFNLKLKEAVDQLRKDLPSAALTYVDVYSLKYELFSHATKHGTMCIFLLFFFFSSVYRLRVISLPTPKFASFQQNVLIVSEKTGPTSV